MIWGACLADTAFLKATPFEVSGDTFEESTDGADANGLNTGTGWESASVAVNFVLADEDFESYADGDDINGKSGGTEFAGNWAGA
jgi:hypothetical protein